MAYVLISKSNQLGMRRVVTSFAGVINNYTVVHPERMKVFKNKYLALQYQGYRSDLEIIPYDEAKQILEEQAKLLALYQLTDN